MNIAFNPTTISTEALEPANFRLAMSDVRASAEAVLARPGLSATDARAALMTVMSAVAARHGWPTLVEDDRGSDRFGESLVLNASYDDESGEPAAAAIELRLRKSGVVVSDGDEHYSLLPVFCPSALLQGLLDTRPPEES